MCCIEIVALNERNASSNLNLMETLQEKAQSANNWFATTCN